LWVPGIDCINIGCVIHNLYDHDSSSTYKAHGGTFTIKYSSGKFSGFWSNDTINLMGLKTENVTFGEMITGTSKFALYKFDGILGLAWPALSIDDNIKPWFN